MALEPSGKAAGHASSGESSEPRERSLPRPEALGFEESKALFRTAGDLPIELRALRGHVDPVVLRYAAARSEELGIPADTVLRQMRVTSGDALLQVHASALNAKIEWLDDSTASALDVSDTLSRSEIPGNALGTEEPPIVALEGENIRRLYEQQAANPILASRRRITSPERLRFFLARTQDKALAQAAAFGLKDSQPQFSAVPRSSTFSRKVMLAALFAAALSLYLAPGTALLAVEIALAAVFLSWAMLRIFSCLTVPRIRKTVTHTERELPIYTVLIPLHDEASIVPELVDAMSALNYPGEKLDIKFILEPSDATTMAALQAIRLDPCFEIFLAPKLGPQTKPKALRAALPFARGEFLVVYDAEDRPHPDQLRDAYARFAECGDELVCVQAKLAIDNAKLSFLSSHFRAEYSGLFDVLLPALARLRLPVPLGGTSNHFRTRTLREIGGWDPHNVTEDADLGVRLARFGYKTGIVDSTTYEEAPARLGAWLQQRTRWMKGWLQTYFVHMRDPLLLLRQMKWRGFLAFQLLIGGSVLAALVHPIYVLWLVADSLFGSLFQPGESLSHAIHRALVFVTLASGYIASGVLAIVGMRRRRAWSPIWVILTIPIYWLLLSAAAWRAVWKLITAPYQWEKTAHGVVPRVRET